MQEKTSGKYPTRRRKRLTVSANQVRLSPERQPHFRISLRQTHIADDHPWLLLLLFIYFNSEKVTDFWTLFSYNINYANVFQLH